MPDEKENPKEATLRRELGLWDSAAIVIGIIIGVGIFKTPSDVAHELQSPILALCAWVFGGALCLLGALCYAELGACFPQTGGDYIYLQQAYGDWAGFLFGWEKLIIVRTGSIAALAYVFAEYLGQFVDISDIGRKLVAATVIAVLSGANLFRLHSGKWIQNVLTATKMGAIICLVFIGFGLAKGDWGNFSEHSNRTPDHSLPVAFGLALIPILWTYGGWQESAYVAEEIKEPQRQLPLSLILGTMSVIILYALVNAVYIYYMPMNEVAASERVAADVADRIFGETGASIISFVVMLSALGCLNGLILTGARISYALAKDNAVFAWMGKVDGAWGTPSRAIVVNAAWATVLVVWGDFRKLVDYTSFTAWLFFGMVAVAVFILRRRFPNRERPYKVWGYPVAPIGFIVTTLWLLANAISYGGRGCLIGLLALLTGLPVYWTSKYLSNRRPIHADSDRR